MPLSFEELADAGVLNSARGMFTKAFGQGPLSGTGKTFANIIQRIRTLGAEKGDIDYETARSVARRALTSLEGARRLGRQDRPLTRNQHGFDPSFQHYTDAEYLYRTIVKCLDESTGEEVRIPVDVESDERLTGAELEERAITAYAKGQTVIRGARSKYPIEGSCIDPIVIPVFAIRTK